MASGISSDLDGIRDALRQGFQQLAIGEDVYKNTLNTLEAKKGDSTPLAKNPSYQEELNKTHAAYLRVIQDSIDNIKAQYLIGLELEMLFQREINFLTLSASLTDIQNRLNPLLVQHKDNEAKLITLKDRIFELINTN
jgi:hypothetical protein